MTLLSDADVAGMRATLWESLPETAVIGSNVGTSDGGGGGTTTWTPSGTVSARIASISGGEDAVANRLAENATWIITLPALTTIDRQDRIVIGARTFEVLAMHAPRSWELSRRVEVAEVT